MVLSWPSRPLGFLFYISAEFGSTDQSKEDCIDGKSIEKCWFSLSKVYPEVDSQNLTVTYKDDTVSKKNIFIYV